MNLEELRAALRGTNTAVIAFKTGLSIATIEAIKSGRNTNPTTKTVTALANFLKGKRDELPSSR